MEADWESANQQYLMARLGLVRRALQTRAGSADEGADAAEDAVRRAADALPAPSALEVLSGSFSLSSFETDLVLLCAGPELDDSFPALCAAAQGDAGHSGPTFGLALAALRGAHWSALAPAAPLRRWRLVELGTGGLTAAPLRLDEKVLHHLAGVSVLDERLVGLVQPISTHSVLAPTQQAAADSAAHLWTVESNGGTVALQLCGADPSTRGAVMVAIGARLGIRALRLWASDLPREARERVALARLWEREAILSGAALLVERDDESPEAARAVAAFVELLGVPVAVGTRQPLTGWQRVLVRVDVARPGPDERTDLWRSALGARAEELEGQVDAVAHQFALSANGIRAVTTEVLASGMEGQAKVELWASCRRQVRPRMDDLAQRIEPTAGWDDLVLPEAECQVLRDLASQIPNRHTVLDRWGFAARSGRGLGVTALFSGPSGTGKTMAAEVLAGELALDLYLIDLSAVVDKYIGETEKNLRLLFDAAEEGGAILLFDEADALFGRRSEVKDSHDRYANLEVSYLLQRMEAYTGLAILTTNMKSALDPAFLRRIRFAVQFPFPDVTQRAEIWRRVFPPETPLEGVDHEALTRLQVTGGNIRNIALGAAFLAADKGEPVRMTHLLRAARTECAKLERPLTAAEVGSWV